MEQTDAGYIEKRVKVGTFKTSPFLRFFETDRPTGGFEKVLPKEVRAKNRQRFWYG